ncbi:MAG: hypothetical protein KME42_19240 [Tildeniella nuda ZEHNDER 1965/U140]|jgi:hypothetical protein|nr:hypothetical protein [Tildeniella nuda ZEHNDER 1965/U140]
MPPRNEALSSVITPWLAILASIIAPLCGLASGVDIFYFGLSIASFSAFSSALIIAFISLLTLSTYQLTISRKITFLLAIVLCIGVGKLVGEATYNTGILIEAHTGPVSDDDYFSYALAGTFNGAIAGFGVGNWIKSLVRAGMKGLYLILPVATGILIVCSGMSSLLQKFDLSFICAVLGVIFVVISKPLYSIR